MNISVLGAGAWGTALAVAASARHEVLLWARDAAQADALVQARCNQRYLPEIALPQGLRLGADLQAALAHARGADALTVVATPMAGLRELLTACAAKPNVATGGRSVLWLSKGLEAGSGLLGHEIAAAVQAAPTAVRWGVLSGPSFALEVARGQPTALVVASADAALCETAVRALHGDALRLYSTNDVIGVEVGGAVKNVLAIAVGALDGLQLGLNARAALITRGLAEMTRLGVALGARAETFMGLSGLGDLVLTTTGALSRNRRVGLLLAEGYSLAQAQAALGHVAEGVPSAPVVLARARSLGVEMPITQSVVALLQGRQTLPEVMAQLMARDARAE
jgi:glycerol-3-phosphate dehydrogenase (NAD(P)+)